MTLKLMLWRYMVLSASTAAVKSFQRKGHFGSQILTMATEKSFAKGTTFPPLEDGKLRLYSMRFCPYAERTRLVLKYLNIPHETINVDLKHKPEWFLERNPLGLVPVLEQGKQIVYESAICDEYLDEVYGKNKLLTTDPYTRARQKIFMELSGKATSAFYGIMKLETQEEKLKGVEKFKGSLQVFEDALVGRFIMGDEPSMVDFHIWPWFERIPAFTQLTGGLELLPAQQFPKLTAWVAAMYELQAVKDVAISTQLHVEFVVQMKTNSERINYDLGLKL